MNKLLVQYQRGTFWIRWLLTLPPTSPPAFVLCPTTEKEAGLFFDPVWVLARYQEEKFATETPSHREKQHSILTRSSIFSLCLGDSVAVENRAIIGRFEKGWCDRHVCRQRQIVRPGEMILPISAASQVDRHESMHLQMVPAEAFQGLFRDSMVSCLQDPCRAN